VHYFFIFLSFNCGPGLGSIPAISRAEELTNMTKIYMHANLNFKLVRIIYTLREKKNVCKHVVEGYTMYLKIIIQRD
jgi:hypothetical protein